MEHLLAGNLGVGERDGCGWAGTHTPEDALMMSIVFDCLKTVAGMKAELSRMTARGITPKRKLKDIQNHLIRDSLWMGEHGEESEFWITACMLHLSEYATETIRQRFVRDRDEVLAILASI